jgi:hypothetical protein
MPVAIATIGCATQGGFPAKSISPAPYAPPTLGALAGSIRTCAPGTGARLGTKTRPPSAAAGNRGKKKQRLENTTQLRTGFALSVWVEAKCEIGGPSRNPFPRGPYSTSRAGLRTYGLKPTHRGFPACASADVRFSFPFTAAGQSRNSTGFPFQTEGAPQSPLDSLRIARSEGKSSTTIVQRTNGQ